ncbi:PepSY-associated TM helix domain-containing protein [Kordiimonas sp.]|uniref:PepSY-associated TM helix domain-containing protein n=1 Tax=Kordiimonas sp. TaxID=1970157 RepID=UPI003A8D7D09
MNQKRGTSRKLKPTIVKLHRWVGLFIAAFLVLQALTGIIISFRDELNGALYHTDAGPNDTPATYEQILAAAKNHQPDRPIRNIVVPSQPGDAYLINYQAAPHARPTLAALSPHDATVVHSGSLLAFPVEAAFELHYRLLMGKQGQNLSGALALLFLGMLGTGLYLWWPKGPLRRGFQVKLTAARVRAIFDIHRVVAAGGAIALIMMAITGFLLAVPDILGSKTSATPSVASHAGAPVTLDQIITNSQNLAAGHTPYKIAFSRDGQLVTLIYKSINEAVNPRATDSIMVDASTGHVVAVNRFEGAGVRQKGLSWALAFHTFDITGWLARPLSLIAGMLLAVISITGIWLWLLRRAARKPAIRRRPST